MQEPLAARVAVQPHSAFVSCVACARHHVHAETTVHIATQAVVAHALQSRRQPLLWLDKEALGQYARTKLALTASFRIGPSQYDFDVDIARPHKVQRHCRGGGVPVLTWRDAAAVLPLINATEILVPQLQQLIADAPHVLGTRYRLENAAQGLLLQDMRTSSQVALEVTHDGTSLCMRFPEDRETQPCSKLSDALLQLVHRDRLAAPNAAALKLDDASVATSISPSIATAGPSASPARASPAAPPGPSRATTTAPSPLHTLSHIASSRRDSASQEQLGLKGLCLTGVDSWSEEDVAFGASQSKPASGSQGGATAEEAINFGPSNAAQLRKEVLERLAATAAAARSGGEWYPAFEAAGGFVEMFEDLAWCGEASELCRPAISCAADIVTASQAVPDRSRDGPSSTAAELAAAVCTTLTASKKDQYATVFAAVVMSVAQPSVAAHIAALGGLALIVQRLAELPMQMTADEEAHLRALLDEAPMADLLTPKPASELGIPELVENMDLVEMNPVADVSGPGRTYRRPPPAPRLDHPPLKPPTESSRSLAQAMTRAMLHASSVLSPPQVRSSSPADLHEMHGAGDYDVALTPHLHLNPSTRDEPLSSGNWTHAASNHGSSARARIVAHSTDDTHRVDPADRVLAALDQDEASSGPLIAMSMATGSAPGHNGTVPKVALSSFHLCDLPELPAHTDELKASHNDDSSTLTLDTTPKSATLSPRNKGGASTQTAPCPRVAPVPKLTLRNLLTSNPEQPSSSSRQARRWLVDTMPGPPTTSRLDDVAGPFGGYMTPEALRQHSGTPGLPLNSSSLSKAMGSLHGNTVTAGKGAAATGVEAMSAAVAEAHVIEMLGNVLRMLRSEKAADAVLSKRRAARTASGAPLSSARAGGVFVRRAVRLRSAPGEVWDDALPGFFHLEAALSFLSALRGHRKQLIALALTLVQVGHDASQVCGGGLELACERIALELLAKHMLPRPEHAPALYNITARALARLCSRPMLPAASAASTPPGLMRWSPASGALPRCGRNVAGALAQLISDAARACADRRSHKSVAAVSTTTMLLRACVALLSCDMPASLRRVHLDALPAAIQDVGSALVEASSHARISDWAPHRFELFDMFLAASAVIMSTPDLSMGALQRMLATVLYDEALLVLIHTYASALVLEEAAASLGKHRADALQLTVLDFFEAYAQMCSRAPALRENSGGDAYSNAFWTTTNVQNLSTDPCRMQNTTLCTMALLGDEVLPSPPQAVQIGSHLGEDDPILDGAVGARTMRMSPVEALGLDDAEIERRGASASRADALRALQPLLAVSGGLLIPLMSGKLASTTEGSAASVPSAHLRLKALEVTHAIISARGSPAAADETLVDQLIQFHYMHFLQSFLVPPPARQPSAAKQDAANGLDSARSFASTASADGVSLETLQRELTLGHLRVLTALANQKHAHVHASFARQRIVQFLLSELDLEYHVYSQVVSHAERMTKAVSEDPVGGASKPTAAADPAKARPRPQVPTTGADANDAGTDSAEVSAEPAISEVQVAAVAPIKVPRLSLKAPPVRVVGDTSAVPMGSPAVTRAQTSEADASSRVANLAPITPATPLSAGTSSELGFPMTMPSFAALQQPHSARSNAENAPPQAQPEQLSGSLPRGENNSGSARVVAPKFKPPPPPVPPLTLTGIQAHKLALSAELSTRSSAKTRTGDYGAMKVLADRRFDAVHLGPEFHSSSAEFGVNKDRRNGPRRCSSDRGRRRTDAKSQRSWLSARLRQAAADAAAASGGSVPRASIDSIADEMYESTGNYLWNTAGSHPVMLSQPASPLRRPSAEVASGAQSVSVTGPGAVAEGVSEVSSPDNFAALMMSTSGSTDMLSGPFCRASEDAAGAAAPRRSPPQPPLPSQTIDAAMEASAYTRNSLASSLSGGSATIRRRSSPVAAQRPSVKVPRLATPEGVQRTHHGDNVAMSGLSVASSGSLSRFALAASAGMSPSLAPGQFDTPAIEGNAMNAVALLVPVADEDGCEQDDVYDLVLDGAVLRRVQLPGDQDEDCEMIEELEDELGVLVEWAPRDAALTSTRPRVDGLDESGLSDASSSDDEPMEACVSPSIVSRQARRDAAGVVVAGSSMSHGDNVARQESSSLVPDRTWCAEAQHSGLLAENSGPILAAPRRGAPVRSVPRLSLTRIDVLEHRARAEAAGVALQDESMSLRPPTASAPGTPMSGFEATDFGDFSSKQAAADTGDVASIVNADRPLSALEGRAIHADSGAHFKMQHAVAASQRLRSATTQRRSSLARTAFDYDAEADSRALYHDAGIHVALLELLLSAILTEDGQLHPHHTPSEEPSRAADTVYGKNADDVCTVLYYHLNHPRNAGILPALLAAAHRIGAPAVRLLKLLVCALFEDRVYNEKRQMLGRGEFALANRLQVPLGPGTQEQPAHVVERVIECRADLGNSLHVADLLMEVTILERFWEHSGVCPLIDFGVTRESFVKLIVPEFKCSLAEWRDQLPSGTVDDIKPLLKLLLNVFYKVVDAMAILHAGGTVHFDLKLQNIFLDPLPGVTEEDFWRPPSEDPPFRVVIGDFDEACMWPNDTPGHTLRSRGTDFMKSPEMLNNSMHYRIRRDHGFDRRRHKGASASSDVWSVGCLLYQLVFGGEMLFFDPDYMRFLTRLTGGGPLLPTVAEAKLEQLPVVDLLLRPLLQRSPEARPEMRRLQARLILLQRSGRLDGRQVSLPAYCPPPPRSFRAGNVTGSIRDGRTGARNGDAAHGALRIAGSAELVSLTSWRGAVAPGALLASVAAQAVVVCPGVTMLPTAAAYSARCLFGTSLDCVMALLPRAADSDSDAGQSAVCAPGSARERARNGVLGLAAALEVACVLVSLARAGGCEEDLAAMRELQLDARSYNEILVLYDADAVVDGLAVASVLMMTKHSLDGYAASIRLRRCCLEDSFSVENMLCMQRAVK